MIPLQERFKEAIDDIEVDTDNWGHYGGFKKGSKNDAAIACEKIADEFAEEFATWMDDNGCTKFNGGWASILDTEKSYTINELLQQFKGERK